MSTTAGVFSETLLLDIIDKASTMINADGSRIKQQYLPRIKTLDVLKSLQTAQEFNQLQATDKKKILRLSWINACAVTDGAVSECTYGTTELSTNIEQYTPNIEREVDFAIDGSKLTDNEFGPEEVIAKGLMRAETKLLEWYAQQSISVLNANLGVNDYPGQFTNSGTYTEIGAPYWNADLIPYFMLAAEKNKFEMAKLLSGELLYQHAMKAQFMTDKGAANMFGQMGIEFDVFNPDTVNTPNKVAYLISEGAVALVTKAYNPVNPVAVGAGEKWYQMTSNYLPWVVFDVFYKNECYQDRIFHKFRVKLTALTAVNPTGCDADNTGILGFKCV